MKIVAIVVFAIAALIYFEADAADIRYCTDTPERDAKGKIKRSRAVIAEFKREHPCPVTGESTGACPGWSIDHVIPLACGGCDQIHNLQWLTNEIKSCSGNLCKDRWERTIYCRDQAVLRLNYDTPR